MRLFTTFFLLFLTLSLTGQTFKSVINTSADLQIGDAVETEDSNFILVGTKIDRSSWDLSALILKVNSYGIPTKSVVMEVPTQNIGLSNIVQLSPDTFIVAGGIQHPNSIYKKLWLFKLNKQLDTIWSKTFTLSANKEENCFQLRKVGNQQLAMTGEVKDSTQQHPFFFKCSITGDSLVYKTYPKLNSNQYSSDITSRPNGNGFYLFGMNFKDAIDGGEMMVIQPDGTKDTVIELTNIFPNITAKTLPDSNIILTGFYLQDTIAMNYNKEQTPIYITNEDSQLFFNHFGKPDTSEQEPFEGLDYVRPDKIYIGGTSHFDWMNSYFSSRTTFFNLAQVDQKGTINWHNYYSDSSYISLWKVLATKDSGCLMIGNHYHPTTSDGNERDLIVWKVDKNGDYVTDNGVIDYTLTLNPSQTVPVKSFTIYPNPTSQYLNIKIDESTSTEYIFKLYNITGVFLMSHLLNNPVNQLSLDHLTQGLYLYTIIDKNTRQNIQRGKIVIN